MNDLYINPEDRPQDDEFPNRDLDTHDFPTTIAGPGGVTTFIENNERGILQETIWQAMGTFKQAELGSMHNAQRQGIYKQDGKYGE
jgi:hypothetical protein